MNASANGGPTCDCCKSTIVVECACRRCQRESPDERFYACHDHLTEVNEKHVKIRCYPATWPVTEPRPPRSTR